MESIMKRPSDDPYHRIRTLAENRAKANGYADPAAAGRKAMALRKLALEVHIEPNTEHILQVVAGGYRAKADATKKNTE